MSGNSLKVAGFDVSTGLYIGGKWVQGRGTPLETINPATEESIGSVSHLPRLYPYRKRDLTFQGFIQDSNRQQRRYRRCCPCRSGMFRDHLG